MEDAITVEPGFLSTDFVRYDFFAVYDGHGGSRVAQACRDRLHRVLAKEIEDEDQVIHNHSDHQEVINRKDHLVVDDVENFDDQVLDWEKIMYSCFSKMDDEITGNGIEEENGSGSMKTIGSTAVVAILGKEKLVVANCGDSRAVLSRGGTAIPLSRDHKPDRPDELERVEAAGGRVINWNGSRVLGVLATSRSIGDYYLKPYVISKPEVTVIERTINDEFLILASDGLWDVMSNETACQVVRKCLKGRMLRTLSMAVKGNNAGEAAAVLAELAMARGSKDNISVVVVELKKSSGYFF
ncbi:Protein phosphatase 2C (PP2C)-like domain [Macleaya cordata]|uniref:protein-serine/threonine phosphatase n=1 Tax=Macleaya cordata TaxID=56857 RepID=A0A200Q5J9_MACCD|nr:Protein phosphatase 2C (PP2C)-like domain [Macleaya cordata]